MGRVYVLDIASGDTKRAVELQPITCRNEDMELQQLLETCLDLLPVEEMGLGAGTKWILIKREMPVPSPETGENQWSLDFLLADSNGIPTLVKCKLCSNMQSRREIVGQMFEYAANGRAYWDQVELTRHAEKSAGSREALEVRIKADCNMSVDDFFSQVAANLKSGKMRLVFLLERSPKELRSVVEFLSDQLPAWKCFSWRLGNLRMAIPA